MVTHPTGPDQTRPDQTRPDHSHRQDGTCHRQHSEAAVSVGLCTTAQVARVSAKRKMLFWNSPHKLKRMFGTVSQLHPDSFREEKDNF